MAFKSEKDKEAYVGKLRAAGFTPEEIDADVAEIEASKPAPVAPPASAPAAAAVAPPKPAPVASTSLQPGNATELVTKLAEAAQARSEQNQDLTGQVLGNQLSQAIKDLSGSDLGKVGLAVGAGYGLYKAGRLAERKFGPSGEMDISRRVEPTMEPPRESARLPEAAQQPRLSATDEALLARSEANRLAKEQDAARRAATAVPEPIPEPPAFIRNQPPAFNYQNAFEGVSDDKLLHIATKNEYVSPEFRQAAAQELQKRQISMATAPLNVPPAGAAAPPVAPAPVAPPVAAPVVEAPVVQAPVAEAAPAPTPAPVPTPTVAEAPPKKEPKAAKAKIEMPQGWGKGMSWLTHQYGVEGAQAFIDQYNKGKPYATYDEMMKSYKENTTRPKYSDIPKSVRQERGITSRSGVLAVPPPSLQSAPNLSTGGSLVRSLTDPLQLKQ